MRKTDYPYCDNGCQVDNGFFYAFRQIRDQMMETVLILKLFYPDSTIVISGDSLGAAISTHALVHLVWSGFKVQHLSTQGSFRVGEAHRLVPSNDPVPHLPPWQMGYNHIPTEIYYKNRTEYKISDDSLVEDETCSIANKMDLTVINHTHYFYLDQIVSIPLCQ